LSQVVVTTVTIAASGTVSGATFDLSDFSIVGVVTPSALTGTALTFQVSVDGSTFVLLQQASGAYSLASVAASRAIAVDPDMFRAWRYAKVVSGSAEAAERVITLVLDRVA
jgi:hypothetical protein